MLLAVASLPKVAEFAAQVPAFQGAQTRCHFTLALIHPCFCALSRPPPFPVRVTATAAPQRPDFTQALSSAPAARAEKIAGEGFRAGGPGHAVGLVWPAIAAPAAAAEGATPDPSALPELFALLSQQPCDAVAIDALYLLLDVSRARVAQGQPPLRQLQGPVAELQGRLRAAVNEAAAAAAAAKEAARAAGGAGGAAGEEDGEKKGPAGGALGAGGVARESAAEVEAEKVRVRAGLALRAVKELLLLLSGGGVRKSD